MQIVGRICFCKMALRILLSNDAWLRTVVHPYIKIHTAVCQLSFKTVCGSIPCDWWKWSFSGPADYKFHSKSITWSSVFVRTFSFYRCTAYWVNGCVRPRNNQLVLQDQKLHCTERRSKSVSTLPPSRDPHRILLEAPSGLSAEKQIGGRWRSWGFLACFDYVALFLRKQKDKWPVPHGTYENKTAIDKA